MPNPSTSALLQAPWYVLLHLVISMAALVVGLVIVLRAKGTSAHKASGRVWALLMVATALISFLIQRSGHFSWIHLLSAWTLVAVALGVHSIRRGRLGAHKRYMIGTLVGLVVAGGFTLLPHRILGKLVFGAP